MFNKLLVLVSFVAVLLVFGVPLANAQSLKERIGSADRVVVGKVVLIKAESVSGLPISEHNPNWHDVVIEAKETLKGKPNLALLVVRFPKSMDVAWYGVPRFSLGQEGIWILHKDESGVYTALNPLDFQPKKEIDNIRTLVKQK